MQLLHPVLTFGLLVRARFCLGRASDGDEEDMVTDTGCGWWVMASSGAVARETDRSDQCASRCEEAHYSPKYRRCRQGPLSLARALSLSHSLIHTPIYTMGWQSRLAGHGKAGDDAGEKAGLGRGPLGGEKVALNSLEH